jgi:hypothetical protein
MVIDESRSCCRGMPRRHSGDWHRKPLRRVRESLWRRSVHGRHHGFADCAWSEMPKTERRRAGHPSRTLALTCALLAHVANGSTALSQVAPAHPDPEGAPACSYRSCALSITPAWNGLAVVRGTHGARVANLNFFWPRDIERALRGSTPAAPGGDSAAASARRALRLRRVGAVLTDVGLVASAATLARVLERGRAERTDQVVGGAALSALVLSVPIQFAADGALSRAIWWHNLRYAR